MSGKNKCEVFLAAKRPIGIQTSLHSRHMLDGFPKKRIYDFLESMYSFFLIFLLSFTIYDKNPKNHNTI